MDYIQEFSYEVEYYNAVYALEHWDPATESIGSAISTAVGKLVELLKGIFDKIKRKFDKFFGRFSKVGIVNAYSYAVEQLNSATNALDVACGALLEMSQRLDMMISKLDNTEYVTTMAAAIRGLYAQVQLKYRKVYEETINPSAKEHGKGAKSTKIDMKRVAYIISDAKKDLASADHFLDDIGNIVYGRKLADETRIDETAKKLLNECFRYCITAANFVRELIDTTAAKAQNLYEDRSGKEYNEADLAKRGEDDWNRQQAERKKQRAKEAEKQEKEKQKTGKKQSTTTEANDA